MLHRVVYKRYNYEHFPDPCANIDKALLEGFQARITVGSSNKLVVVNYIEQCPDRSSIRPCRAHAVLFGHCNYIYM